MSVMTRKPRKRKCGNRMNGRRQKDGYNDWWTE
jgi:hypothetical protein